MDNYGCRVIDKDTATMAPIPASLSAPFNEHIALNERLKNLDDENTALKVIISDVQQENTILTESIQVLQETIARHEAAIKQLQTDVAAQVYASVGYLCQIESSDWGLSWDQKVYRNKSAQIYLFNEGWRRNFLAWHLDVYEH